MYSSLSAAAWLNLQLHSTYTAGARLYGPKPIFQCWGSFIVVENKKVENQCLPEVDCFSIGWGGSGGMMTIQLITTITYRIFEADKSNSKSLSIFYFISKRSTHNFSFTNKVLQCFFYHCLGGPTPPT